jgi:hypothetical protein
MSRLALPPHDQIGMDLGKHAGDRASKAMRDALSLCEDSAQASMVAFQVLGVIAAQACGVVTEHLGINLDELDSAAMMELMADLFREVKENPELASGLALREQRDV